MVVYIEWGFHDEENGFHGDREVGIIEKKNFEGKLR